MHRGSIGAARGSIGAARAGSGGTETRDGGKVVLSKQKQCKETTAELMEELETHKKPAEVRELVAGLMVFDFKLKQFDLFLEEEVAGFGDKDPFINSEKLIATYDKVLLKVP